VANYKSFAAWQKAFNKNTKKIMKELSKSMPEVGEMIEASVKKRTRLGYGVDGNYKSKSKLAKLTDQYKKHRKRLKKKGKLSKDTSPAKSNLTKSGSMLDKLSTKINKKKYTVQVKPSGADSDGVSNKKKSVWVSKDRPYLYLSTPEIKRITKLLRKELDKIVNKIFK